MHRSGERTWERRRLLRVLTWVALGAAAVVGCLPSVVEWSPPGREGDDPPQHVHLSWADGDASATTMAITWITKEPRKTIVRYGLTQDYDQVGHGKSVYSELCKCHIHEIELKQLTPNTQYHYRCGDGPNLSEGLTFSTGRELGSAKPFSFAVWGDTREASREEIKKKQRWNALTRVRISEAILELNPAFSVLLGDMVDRGANDQKEWDRIFTELEPLFSRISLMPSVGNHEYFSFKKEYRPPRYLRGALSRFYEQFQLPDHESWYSFQFQNIQFIILDVSGPTPHTKVPYYADYTRGSEQYAWLSEELERTKDDPRIRWRFVGFHCPYYSTWAGRKYPGQKGTAKDDIAQVIEKLEEYEIDIVFASHMHAYERSHAMRGGAVTGTETDHINPKGIVHVVSGAAGAPLMWSADSTPRRWRDLRKYEEMPWLAYAEAENHFVRIDVTHDKLTSTAYREDGTVMDRFSITKTR